MEVQTNAIKVSSILSLPSPFHHLTIYSPISHHLLPSSTNILGLVVFAVVTGIAIAQCGEDGKPLLKFFESISIVMMKVILRPCQAIRRMMIISIMSALMMITKRRMTMMITSR